MRLNLAALLVLVAFTAHDPAGGAVLRHEGSESCTNFALAGLEVPDEIRSSVARF